MPKLLHRYLKNPRLWQLVLACYWLALFIATHIPIERLALSRGTGDKFAHVTAFAMLALLLAITWRLSAGRLKFRQMFTVWAIVMLYGAVEETSQPIAGRTASLFDWSADAGGATLGLAVYWFWLRGWIDKLVPTHDRATHDTSTWRRYSLRTLFVGMTVVAVACYWLMLPTMNAQRFVRAIKLQDYATADSLFIDKEERFFEEAQTTGTLGYDPLILPLTWRDLWAGRRHISLPLNAEAGGECVHILVNRQGVVTSSFSA